jgi:hypothetical protein
VLDSKAREDGLFLKIMISKTAPEKWQQITEGVLNKFSVRGKVVEARKKWIAELKRHARVILKMRLVEVSLVAVPANPKARAIRWYVEKALDEFEKAGGLLDSEARDPMGGSRMNGDEKVEPREVTEELIEATGSPAPEGGAPGSVEKKDEAEGEEDVRALVGKLLAGEKDAARRKLIERVLAIVTARPVSKSGEDDATDGDAAVAKAGRKLSGDRLARLKKLLVELGGLVAEVDDSSAAAGGTEGAPVAKAGKGEGADADKTLSKIAKALGIGESGDGDVPDLAKAVKELKERLDELESTPGSRTSLDGQEDLADEGKGKGEGSVFKGLL